MKSRQIAYIVGTFPKLSETFVLNEVDGLRSLGFNIQCFSFDPCSKSELEERALRWVDNTIYQPALFSFKMLASHLYFFLRMSVSYISILLRNQEYGGKRVFFAAVYFARIIKLLGIRHVHAHWAGGVTDAAIIVSRLAKIPYSFTGHASDIYFPQTNLSQQIEGACFVITCGQGNKEYLGNGFGHSDKIHAIYHGIDLQRFARRTEQRQPRIDILSVTRLVDKKGIDYLVEACRMLKAKGVLKRCVIVGDGPEMEKLQSLVHAYDLAHKIELKGAMKQEDIVPLYHQARVFALPCILVDGVSPNGIPNVLVEAMAVGVPVVSTSVPQIPELVEHRVNGLLVPERDPVSLASAIEELMTDKEMAGRIADQARKKVERDFDVHANNRLIADIFDSQVGVGK